MFQNSAVARPLRASAVLASILGILVVVTSSAAPASAHGVSRPPKAAHGCAMAYAARHRMPRAAARHRCADQRQGGRLAVGNSFGQGLFGIATGSTLQNEARTPALLRHDLSNDRAAGARWIRLDINWAQIQQHGPSRYYWEDIDAAVRRAQANGMHVLGTIVFTPSWARPAGTTATYGPDPRTYARFAGIAARHYSGLGVTDYEIWNEPNSQVFWTPRPRPAAYTALLRAAYVAIKGADPNATVLTGGTAPAATDGASYSPVSFLSRIYADGGEGYFDAVANHPYCWPAYPGDADNWSAWYQMYGTPTSLRSLMIAHGDRAKKIWATEFGAPTGGPIGTYVSEVSQARMVTRAYRLFATYRWAGPLFFYSSRDLGYSRRTEENFFGFLNRNFTPKPSFTAYHRAMLSVRALVIVSKAVKALALHAPGAPAEVLHRHKPSVLPNARARRRHRAAPRTPR